MEHQPEFGVHKQAVAEFILFYKFEPCLEVLVDFPTKSQFREN